MRLQRIFLTGLLALLPLSVTVYLIMLAYTNSASAFRWLASALGLVVPGWMALWLPILGLMATVILIAAVGAATSNWLGRRLLGALERLVGVIPLVRDIYGAVGQISRSLLGQPEMHFSRAALIEYPRKGVYTLCFVVQPAENRLPPLSEGYTVVMVPTSPVPVSGFLVMVPDAEITPLEVRVEEALRMVISVGFLMPENRTTMPKNDSVPRESDQATP